MIGRSDTADIGPLHAEAHRAAMSLCDQRGKLIDMPDSPRAHRIGKERFVAADRRGDVLDLQVAVGGTLMAAQQKVDP